MSANICQYGGTNQEEARTYFTSSCGVGLYICQFVPISRESKHIHTTLSTVRNGAKICDENPRIFTERKILGKVINEIYYSLQHQTKLPKGEFYSKANSAQPTYRWEAKLLIQHNSACSSWWANSQTRLTARQQDEHRSSTKLYFFQKIPRQTTENYDIYNATIKTNNADCRLALLSIKFQKILIFQQVYNLGKDPNLDRHPGAYPGGSTDAQDARASPLPPPVHTPPGHVQCTLCIPPPRPERLVMRKDEAVANKKKCKFVYLNIIIN